MADSPLPKPLFDKAQMMRIDNLKKKNVISTRMSGVAGKNNLTSNKRPKDMVVGVSLINSPKLTPKPTITPDLSYGLNNLSSNKKIQDSIAGKNNLTSNVQIPRSMFGTKNLSSNVVPKISVAGKNNLKPNTMLK